MRGHDLTPNRGVSGLGGEEVTRAGVQDPIMPKEVPTDCRPRFWSFSHFHSVQNPSVNAPSKTIKQYWGNTSQGSPLPWCCLVLTLTQPLRMAHSKVGSCKRTNYFRETAIEVSPKIASCNTVGFVKLLQEVSRNSFTKSRTASYSCNGAESLIQPCHVFQLLCYTDAIASWNFLEQVSRKSFTV